MLEQIKNWITSFFPKKEIVVIKKKRRYVATRHAQKRLEERHGMILTSDMAEAMVEEVKSGRATFLKDALKGAGEWIVVYNDKRFRIIYDSDRERIITIYPGIKNKRRKYKRTKKKIEFNHRAKKKHSYKSKREPYKRNKKVDYD